MRVRVRVRGKGEGEGEGKGEGQSQGEPGACTGRVVGWYEPKRQQSTRLAQRSQHTDGRQDCDKYFTSQHTIRHGPQDCNK